MAQHIVKCRVCHQSFDTNDQNINWVMPSRNFYYHAQCYEDFAKKKISIRDDIHADVDNELWFSALYEYLKKDLKMSLDMRKTKSQWKNYLNRGYTAKGIYFCMRYFYEVQHGDPTKGDGIGIVGYIYNEGCQYWVDREQKDAGICERIEAQIRHANEQQKVVITLRQQKPKKATIDLAAIEGMEDDE